MQSPVKEILLIDDDPVYNEINALLLKKLYPDINVHQTTSVDMAIEHIQRQSSPPDLIFLDLNLPGKGGLEFIKVYRKHFNQNNIYLLSSASQLLNKEIRQTYKQVAGVIEKPLQEHKLKQIMG